MLNLLVDESSSILDVLKTISESGRGIVFVMRGTQVVGSISDGDIRRRISMSSSIDFALEEVMNSNFHFATLSDSPADIQKIFSNGVRLIPLLDFNGNLIQILQENDKPVIPICEPNLGIAEKNLVNEALNSGWISSTGRFVDQFESIFADYVGAQHAIAVSNGTLGLVLALKLMGVGEGDEVIVPDLTFGATANAVIQSGAKPVFVDTERYSYTICLDQIKLAITAKTKAILPVHLYGYPADMRELCKFAKLHNLKVIEDAAEAIGSRINGKHVGTFGDVGVFSFFANKTITTGEGGMIVFNDPTLLDAAKMMRSHGFSSKKRYWHETWGSNFRLTNLQAALGVAQMSRLQDFVDAKVSINRFYQEHLVSNANQAITFPGNREGFFDSYWLSVIQFDESIDVMKMGNFLQVNGVETRRVFYPLHAQPAFSSYTDVKSAFPNSIRAHENGLCLPSSTNLKVDDLEKICTLITKYLERL